MKIKKKIKKGFTLIELLAVIVILAIIIAITIPTVSGIIENSKANTFKASVQNILKQAAAYAVSKGVSSGYISDLNISNNNITGTWSYNDATRVVTLYGVSGESAGIVGKNGVITSNDINNLSVQVFANMSLNNIFDSNKLNSYGKISNGYLIDNDNSLTTEPNNYVWYSGQLWRAIKKDSNGVWLMTENNVTAIPFGSNSGEKYRYNSSYGKDWLNNVFLSTLNGYSDDTFLKTVNFDKTDYNDNGSYGWWGEYNRSGTSSYVSGKVGLFSMADYGIFKENPSLAGGGYCTSVTGQTLTQYTDESSCYSGPASCSDPSYTDQDSCQNVGYCSGMTYVSMSEYDGNEEACWNNGGYYDGYSCYRYDYYDHPEYNNNPSGCYGAGYDFNGGWNYWGTPNWNSSTNTYLNNNSNFWTMNTTTGARSWAIQSDFSSSYGYGDCSVGDNASYGIRPVIVINPDNLNATIISGNGTKTVPYKLKIDELSTTNKNLNNRLVGEYVNYSGYKWRIQDKTNGIKLIMSDTIGMKVFDPNNTPTFNPSDSNNIGYYLNNDFLGTLDQSKIIDTVFKIGKIGWGQSYRVTFESPAPQVTAKVGLPRLGEMFSGMDLMNNDYTISNKNYFSITPWDSWSGTYLFYLGSYMSYTEAQYSNNIRPVISINSSSIIKGGTGTFSDPFVLQ